MVGIVTTCDRTNIDAHDVGHSCLAIVELAYACVKGLSKSIGSQKLNLPTPYP